MRTLYSFSLLCLFSLILSSTIRAGDNFTDFSMFGFPNDGASYGESSSSRSDSDLDEGWGDALGYVPEDRELRRRRLPSVDYGVGVGSFSEEDDDDDLDDTYFYPVEPTETDGSDLKLVDDGSATSEICNLNMFMRWWKESTSAQVWGLAGMVAILSYGGYRLYDWWLGLSVTKLVITTYDQECANVLLDAMHEDIEVVKLGKRQLPAANLVDLSKMTPEFAVECQMIQQTFMNMYKSCQDNAEQIVLLEEFYSSIAQAIKNLDDHAEIIDVSEVALHSE